MNQRQLKLGGGLLMLAAVLSMMYVALWDGRISTLPLAAAARGLRWLSLSGAVGNTIAILLYVVLCLAPLLLFLPVRRTVSKLDLLLPVTSVVMFYVVYGLINPGFRPLILTGIVGDYVTEGAVISVLLTWGIIRLVQACGAGGFEKICGLFGIFLLLSAVLCVISGFGGGLSSLISSMDSVKAKNTAPGMDLSFTMFFLFFRFLTRAAEYGLTAWVLILGMGLVSTLRSSPYGEENVGQCQRLAKWSRISLIVILLLHLALNLGQVFFAGSLRDLAVSVNLPLLGITVNLLCLVLAGLLQKGRALQEDNDLFI